VNLAEVERTVLPNVLAGKTRASFAPSVPAQTLSIGTVDHAREAATIFEGMPENAQKTHTVGNP
jgi:hypothetical protein